MFLTAPIETLPKIGSPDMAERTFGDFAAKVAKLDRSELRDPLEAFAKDPQGRALLTGVFSGSPFLSQVILADLEFFSRLLTEGPDALFVTMIAEIKGGLAQSCDRSRLMTELRIAKRRAALLIALADLAGRWSLEQVTGALSELADAALSSGLTCLLNEAAETGDITLADGNRVTPDNAGYVVLAMGKLGAGELNYSSDIDVIALYDPLKLRYGGRRSLPERLQRLTRDLTTLLDQRTPDGYVFRTDLRLRPDPSAMPLAMTVNAAETYYESLGQNWERAAMIKARPAAGDLATGRGFLKALRPFVWRKNLDFWAIRDIHSIKRQINAHRGGGQVNVLGHDVKLGRGGIREIEFFVQTQQLVWGGRNPDLRSSRTIAGLNALAEAGRIDQEAADRLSQAYRFLRQVEHRLQMVEDQQTHRLPDSSEDLQRFAAFLGYASAAVFEERLLGHLKRVEDYYGELFESSAPLAKTGNLVFTGSTAEPNTLSTLKDMGFADGERVFQLVSGWHRGRYRAMRSTRSRELLTELVPALLEAFAKTANPDLALGHFDAFLSGLPTGVQLFSMINARPSLLDLLAEIMGSGPALADRLAARPGLLEGVLSGDFFDPLPLRADLQAELTSALGEAGDLQDALDASRRWANDRKFQAGVHILRQSTSPEEAARGLSDIADTVISGLFPPVTDDFARRHGRITGPGLAVVALGKLGSREMTVGSDVDLVFIYQAEPAGSSSDGPKPLADSHYFARLGQRLISALSALTPEGRLYEIDMRLRPSGNAGPIATSLAGFVQYHEKEAWTWEHMALTRARPLVGDAGLLERIQAEIGKILCRPRDPDSLLRDVADMRQRIDREHRAQSLWNIKHLRGGLIDLEFIAQYLTLRHAADHPEVLDTNTVATFAQLAQAGLLGRSLSQRLIEATRLMQSLQGMLRLTIGSNFDEAATPPGIKEQIAQTAGLDSFAALKDRLITTAQMVQEIYFELIDRPASALPPADPGSESS